METQDGVVNKKILGSSTLIAKLLGVAIVALVIYTLIISFQRGGIVTKTAETADQIVELEEQIAAFGGDKVLASNSAVEALQFIEDEEIRWSQIIELIDARVPTDATGSNTVQVLSYSGSSEGRISLSMTTNPATDPPFADVARTISSFDSEIYFNDVYVPSISKGIDQRGQTILNFVLNLTYEDVTEDQERVATPRVKTN